MTGLTAADSGIARPDVIVDVRCLQDPNYAGRGVGRHAAALLAHARNSPTLAAGARLLALRDPAMPPLAPDILALFDGVRGTAHPGAMTRPVWFVELSPMTHDPLFVAPLLHHAAPLTAAVVFDFIPLDEAERYLARSRVRIDYHVALAWLARYEILAPISQSSAARLKQLVNPPDGDVVVTGAPLGPMFAPGDGRGAATHVLVVGGGDARKNVECAIRGHAGSPAMQQGAIPLVITGYPASQLQAMRTLATAAGGNPEFVRVPGHVDEAALAALYRDALCVVVPSRAEGFSLPVIEAMASGSPAIASDIDVHAELIADRSLLFPPEAPANLAAILDRLQADPAARAAAVATQSAVWPRYRAAAVAERFWSALEARAASRRILPAAPARLGRRPRVALITPLQPDHSGVADFSAAGCAAMGADVDLHVFTATVNPAHPPGATTVRPLTALPYLSADFDRVVSVMGNSEFHLGIFHLLTRYGGACIAHDSRMLGFYCSLFSHARAEAIGTRELGRKVTRADVDEWLVDEARLPTALLAELADAAQPMLMHSRSAAAAVTGQTGVQVGYLPFAVYRPWDAAALLPAARAAARARLGLQPGTIMIASFGVVHPNKAPEDALLALETLRGWGIPAELHFVGPNYAGDGPAMLARSIGVSAHVVAGGSFIDEAGYRDRLLAADLGLQLRGFGNGAVSGALQDCITAGLATVANADLADAIESPDYVRRVPDALSPMLIAEALANLLDEGAHLHRHVAAREAYVDRHGFPRYAQRLWQALGLDLGGRA